MKVFRIQCVVERRDGTRAFFFENVISDTEAGALAMVKHFETTYPTPRAFAANVVATYEVGDPQIPKLDKYHPMFWGNPYGWSPNAKLLWKESFGAVPVFV